MTEEQINEYKKFVDELARLYDKHLILSDFNNPDDEFYSIKEKLDKVLNNEEIDKINKLLKHLHQSGIFRTLEFLNEKSKESQLKLISNGIEIPVEPYGNGIDLDWIQRCEGESWPDEMLCHVHDIKLQVEEVPIKYGLIKYPSEYYELKKKYFPFANNMVDGGCMKGREDRQRVAYCIKCREYLKSWNNENNTEYGYP